MTASFPSPSGSCCELRATLTAIARPSTSVPSAARPFCCSVSETVSTNPNPLDRLMPNFRLTIRAVATWTPASVKTFSRPSSSRVKGRLATKRSVLEGSPVGASLGARGARGARTTGSPVSSSIRAAALAFRGGRVALGAGVSPSAVGSAAVSPSTSSFLAPRRRGGRCRNSRYIGVSYELTRQTCV